MFFGFIYSIVHENVIVVSWIIPNIVSCDLYLKGRNYKFLEDVDMQSKKS